MTRLTPGHGAAARFLDLARQTERSDAAVARVLGVTRAHISRVRSHGHVSVNAVVEWAERWNASGRPRIVVNISVDAATACE